MNIYLKNLEIMKIILKILSSIIKQLKKIKIISKPVIFDWSF